MNQQKQYLIEQKKIISLLATNIIPFRPGIGELINVNGLEIAKDVFPDEFNQILNIRNSIIKKIKEDNI